MRTEIKLFGYGHVHEGFKMLMQHSSYALYKWIMRSMGKSNGLLCMIIIFIINLDCTFHINVIYNLSVYDD